MVVTDLGYDVIGDPVPDSTGHYDVAGTYGGKPYYEIGGSAFFIWWRTSTDDWWITPAVGNIGGAVHRRQFPNVDGDYTAVGGATGTATVVATE